MKREGVMNGMVGPFRWLSLVNHIDTSCLAERLLPCLVPKWTRTRTHEQGQSNQLGRTSGEIATLISASG